MSEKQGAMVTKVGALSMQVCVPSDWNDEQVKEFADSENLCGTTNGWFVRPEGDSALKGMPYRVQCASPDRPDFVHIMLDA